MPYSLGKSSSCPKGMPFAVMKTQTGEVVPGGCHPTRAKALDHQQALMANVSAEETAAVIGDLVDRLPDHIAMKPPGQLTMPERMQLAKRGLAMPDGSFPCRNMTDLTEHAMPSFGRAGDKGAVKSFLLKRARAMGAGKDIIQRIESYST